MFKKIKYKVNLWRRAMRFWWQRRTRGWDDSVTWNMDCELAKLILPRLKRFREISPIVPCDLTEEEWNKILDKMIAGFEYFASEKIYQEFDNYDEAHAGVKLFAEYYAALWW